MIKNKTLRIVKDNCGDTQKTRCTRRTAGNGLRVSGRDFHHHFPQLLSLSESLVSLRMRSIGKTRSTTGRSSPWPSRRTTSAYSARSPSWIRADSSDAQNNRRRSRLTCGPRRRATSHQPSPRLRQRRESSHVAAPTFSTTTSTPRLLVSVRTLGDFLRAMIQRDIAPSCSPQRAWRRPKTSRSRAPRPAWRCAAPSGTRPADSQMSAVSPGLSCARRPQACATPVSVTSENAAASAHVSAGERFGPRTTFCAGYRDQSAIVPEMCSPSSGS